MLGIALGDLDRELCGEGVGHGVEGLDGGKAGIEYVVLDLGGGRNRGGISAWDRVGWYFTQARAVKGNRWEKDNGGEAKEEGGG